MAERAEWMDAAEVAKLVRAVLKERFPGTRFSVTTDKYAGGASIDVKWADGPGEASVKDAVGRFAGATFDGMIDLKSYLPAMEFGGRTFRSGADYVFCDRTLSFAVLERIVREAVEGNSLLAEAGMPAVREDSSGGGWVDYHGCGYPWEATELMRRYVTEFWRDEAVQG